jgi:hypothetical protein
MCITFSPGRQHPHLYLVLDVTREPVVHIFLQAPHRFADLGPVRAQSTLPLPTPLLLQPDECLIVFICPLARFCARGHAHAPPVATDTVWRAFGP